MTRVLAAALMLLAGCATSRPDSYVTTIQASDADILAGAIDGYVAATIRQPGAAVVVDAPSNDMEVAPRVRDGLERQGYRVAEDDAPGSHRMAYAVSTFDSDMLLVQVFIDNDRRATRLYARDRHGDLAPRGPYAAVEAEQ